jgi:cytochrome c oxidase subunit 2
MKGGCVMLIALAFVGCGAGQAAEGAEAGTAGNAGAVVIQVQASRWSYAPSMIVLKKNVPAVLELTSSDVHHGFNVPGLELRADVLPGQITRVRVTPRKIGTFVFHCDYYCGSGHEEMQGEIVVE